MEISPLKLMEGCLIRDMITKKIWIYWHQGWDQAPPLVQQAKNSWSKLNYGYEIHALDQVTLFDFIEFPPTIHLQRKDLNVQKIAALGRLALLAKYGGVWVDATVVCNRPLDTWLADYHTAQFFAFRNPRPDRLMANWFIAAEPQSIILQRLYESFFAYYADNHFSNQDTVLGNILLRCFNQLWSNDVKTTLKWHTWFARKILRVYPYYIFHYTFNKLILSDPECGKLWHQAKPFKASAPHRLQGLAAYQDGIKRAIREINSGLTPLYKLDWRVDSSTPYWTTVLEYLEKQA